MRDPPRVPPVVGAVVVVVAAAVDHVDADNVDGLLLLLPPPPPGLARARHPRHHPPRQLGAVPHLGHQSSADS